MLRREVVCPPPGDPVFGLYVMPGTPQSDNESILVAPLIVGGEVVGTLNVWREGDLLWFAPEEALLLQRFASLAAMAYANSAQREQLRAQALTDELTGLFNRRHFQRRLTDELCREDADEHAPTSLVYFDLDGFKSINDSFGHEAGDQALRDFSQVLRSQIREHDIACRTGGEEFCVVLPRTGPDDAERLAWRVVGAVRDSCLGPRGDLTVSAGVATAPGSGADYEHLVRQADDHLLRAKREGRDRVVVSAASL